MGDNKAYSETDDRLPQDDGFDLPARERSSVARLSWLVLVLCLLTSAAIGAESAPSTAEFLLDTINTLSRVTLDQDADGDAMLKHHDASGSWRVYLLDCEHGQCHSASFYSEVDAPKFTQADVNRLNATVRYVRFALLNAETLSIQLDIFLGSNQSSEAVKFYTGRWLEAMRRIHLLLKQGE